MLSRLGRVLGPGVAKSEALPVLLPFQSGVLETAKVAPLMASRQEFGQKFRVDADGPISQDGCMTQAVKHSVHFIIGHPL
jgi:hypothetical protein